MKHDSEAVAQPTVRGSGDQVLREAIIEHQRCLKVVEAAGFRCADVCGLGLNTLRVDTTAVATKIASSLASDRSPTSGSGPLEATTLLPRALDSLPATSPLPRAVGPTRVDTATVATEFPSSLASDRSPTPATGTLEATTLLPRAPDALPVTSQLPRASGAMDATCSGRLAPPPRKCDEDEAQMEAIRSLQKLGEKGNKVAMSDARITDVARQLEVERGNRLKAEAALARERKIREATEQQVLRLEVELGQKDAALQVAERALKQRNADLQDAQVRQRPLHDTRGPSTFSGNAIEGRVRSQLIEAEHQLELKDRHVARLLDVLHKLGVLYEEESTACGSEGSMVSTVTLGSEMVV